MGIFSGIGGVQAAGSAKGEWFRQGEYIVRLDKAVAKERRADGQPTLIVEFTVLETLVGNDGSNRPGSKVAWIKVLERTLKGGLTENGEREMSRVKSFLGVALGGVDAADITEEMAEAILEADGTALSGTLFRVKATEGVSKNGKAFTNVDFFPHED